jgi:magnesium transporter
VTSYFGQNVPYPGSGTSTGVIASGLIIIVFSIVLYVMFKRREWL